jgi:hypothetical protein
MKINNLALISIHVISLAFARDCDQVLSRPNIMKMSDQDRNRYFNAVYWLNSGNKPTRWDTFALKHASIYDQVHSQPAFFAWHRRYLIELELMLRQYDPNVRIPYFDWTVNHDHLDQDPVWQYFGKVGNPNQNYCVNDGVFNNFKVFYYADVNRQGSTRCFTRNSAFPQTFSDPKPVVNAKVIDEQDPTNFWNNMELGGHGLFHNGIGMDFSDHISTNDPLFFSHHAFIDMVWFVRQMRHADWGYNYPTPPDFRLPLYNETVQDVLDPTDWCYAYQEDNFSFSSVNVDFLSAENVVQYNVKPFIPYMPPSNLNSIQINTERMKYAADYIFDGVKGPLPNTNMTFPNATCSLIVFNTPMTYDYIIHMKYNEAQVRENERHTALIISNINSACIPQ